MLKNASSVGGSRVSLVKKGHYAVPFLSGIYDSARLLGVGSGNGSNV